MTESRHDESKQQTEQPASPLTYLRDPRIASFALSPRPAWLWSADGARILWANAAAAARFDAENPAALVQRRFDKGMQVATIVARIAQTLAPGQPPRLERLRGLGTGFAPTTCSCQLIEIDGVRSLLMAGLKSTGAGIPQSERIAQLMCGIDEPVALFSADGQLLHAAHPAAERLAAVTNLSFLGLSSLAAEALRGGHATGSGKTGAIAMEHINAGNGGLLLATFGAKITEGTETEAHTHVAPADDASGDDDATHEAASAPQENVTQESVTQESVTQESAEHENAEDAATHDHVHHNDVADPVVTPAPPQDAAQDVFPVKTWATATQDIQNIADAPALEAAPDTQANIAPTAAPVPASPVADRRYPVRFVWQMDPAGHFTIRSDEFIALAGPATEDVLGETWEKINTTLAVDPEDRVSRAIATRDTWSGISVNWPIDGSNDRIAVELSGLPIFERDRVFNGYRGFGVCRDVFQRDANAPDTTPAAVARPQPEPPVFTVATSTANVLPFKSANGDRAASLSPVERNAFQELARQLTTRLQEGNVTAAPETPAAELPSAEIHAFEPPRRAQVAPDRGAQDHFSQSLVAVLEGLPSGVLVYRLEDLLYANAAFLKWSGYSSLAALTADGGLNALFVAPLSAAPGATAEPADTAYHVSTARGAEEPARAVLTNVRWDDEDAHMLSLAATVPAPQAHDDGNAAEIANATEIADGLRAELEEGAQERAELQAIVDAAADGIVVIDAQGRIVSANSGAERLFGADRDALKGATFDSLLASESRAGALNDFNRLMVDIEAPHDGREVTGRQRSDAPTPARDMPLFMTLGRIADMPPRLCAIFRDVSLWKNAERELTAAKRETERAFAAKSEFLAKISHEVRTPLNAIIGFSEVMMSERFGAIGNERYHAYLRDIHASGNNVLMLLNDLLDLSKIEAGKIDLTFASVNLNELTQACVAVVQPQAIKDRIIIRTSLAPALPAIVADARSVRQIILNLLTNSLRLTSAGGQIIVSTAMTENGGGVLRVRDTGAGMSEREVAMALEPFRQLSTPLSPENGGSGLGLPLTKALAEANRAHFTLTSALNAGTLVEVAFPPARAAAE
jgi:PAS domain S-box-containing protein